MRVHVERVAGDLYVLRLDDDEVKYFEALWYIPEGVTYNSYLLLTGDGAVLFDTWKHTYAELFIDTLSKLVDLREIKYIVVHHMEQDHSGALPAVLKQSSEATVIAHPMVLDMIRSFYHVQPKFKPVSDKAVLELGEYKLRFYHTPWLHWPETIMTFIENSAVLLTCDAFGGFSMPSKLFDNALSESEISAYLKYARKYAITVIGHYRNYILSNVEKLKSSGVEPRVIAPAHGLIWRSNPQLIVNKYLEWSRGEATGRKAVILYSSMYGFVEEAVSYVTGKLNDLNWNIHIHKLTDRERLSEAEVLNDVVDSKLVVIGTSNYENDVFPYMRYVLELLVEKANFDKPILVLESYGWGGVTGRKIRELLARGGFSRVAVVEFRGKPDSTIYAKVDEALKKLGVIQ